MLQVAVVTDMSYVNRVPSGFVPERSPKIQKRERLFAGWVWQKIILIHRNKYICQNLSFFRSLDAAVGECGSQICVVVPGNEMEGTESSIGQLTIRIFR